MVPPNKTAPPMVDYTVKLMLLEAVVCYQKGDSLGLKWLEKQMFTLQARLKELERQDG